MAMTIITESVKAAKARFSRPGFVRGFVKALPFLLSNGVAGVVMGVAYRGVGLGFVPAVLFSVLVYSATAQAVTLGMWAAIPPTVPMVVACIATNARYLVMGAHLHQLFGKLRKRIILPILFLLADASWLMTTADAQKNEADAGYLLGASTPMAIGWMGGTALGYSLPLKPGGPFAVAAALLPAAFIVTLLPSQWCGRRSILPWLASAGTALLVSHFMAPNWAMLIGGAVGTGLSLMRGDHA
ncbi:AzlC family ABC transporter permease [Bradyrhizobium genosp. A]|uniref:AzlC family ABC transporter permease n=1 Tax=Bradyrhizobium genosp. A TaxID=83626 RepID=UPI003CECACA9